MSRSAKAREPEHTHRPVMQVPHTHLLTCPHHVGARRAYLGDEMAAGVGDTFGDAWMRQTMNPEEAGGWRRQADFLITALALRDAAERGDAPQVDLPDDAFVT